MPDCRVDPGRATLLDGHVRLLLAWNDAINLTAITDPALVALLHVVDSLAGRAGPRRPAPRATILDLGSGGGLPGPRPGRRAAGGAGHARRVDRQEGGLPRPRPSTPSASGARVAARAEAVAPSRDGAPEPFDVVTARAVGEPGRARRAGAARCSGRAGARSPGSAATSRRSWPRRPRGGRRSVAAGRPSIRTRAIADAAGLEGHVLVVVREGRADAGRLSRAIARPARDGLVTGPCYAGADANRGPVGHPLEPRRARRGPRGGRPGRCLAGSSVTSSATAPTPMASSPGCASSGPSGVAGNHDAAAHRRTPRSTGSTPTPGGRWSGPGPRSARRRVAWLRGSPPDAVSTTTGPSSTAARAIRSGNT